MKEHYAHDLILCNKKTSDNLASVRGFIYICIKSIHTAMYIIVNWWFHRVKDAIWHNPSLARNLEQKSERVWDYNNDPDVNTLTWDETKADFIRVMNNWNIPAENYNIID